MPGIMGILSKQECAEGPQLLKAMSRSMMYEAFYVEASHIDQARGWFVGSVAIEQTFADCMPVHNENQDITLFLAGECYPDDLLATTLKSKGHEFRPGGADYLVHLYEDEGPDFVSKLNGCFSGIVLDARHRKAILFNDRYSMQRIYYYEDASAFYFASEAKALLRAVPTLRSIDPRSIAQYLCFDCVLDEHTYFTDVNLMPGGARWVFDNGRLRKGFHFDTLERENQDPLGSREFFEQLMGTFAEALPRYLGGDNVSIAITGGLDTRLIMAYLPRNSVHLKALTFGGMYRDNRDVRIGRAISQAHGIPHHTLRLDRTYLAEYPNHVARAMYVTDGLADATNADTLHLSHRARTIAPTMIMGAFGSQVLGRVKRALRNRLPDPELIHPGFRPFIETASEALLPFQSEHNLSYELKREIPWYWSRFMASQMAQLTIRNPFLDNDFVDLLYRAPRGGFDGSNFELDAIAKNSPQLLRFRTNKGAGGKAPAPVSAIVQKFITARALADKMLNWDVLPYSLHHAVARVDSLFLSPLRLNRLILGFEYFRHYNFWFRNELAPCLRDILLDTQTLSRPYWNPSHLSRMVNDHIRGRRSYLSEIRKTLTIEFLHRALIETAGT